METKKKIEWVNSEDEWYVLGNDKFSILKVDEGRFRVTTGCVFQNTTKSTLEEAKKYVERLI